MGYRICETGTLEALDKKVDKSAGDESTENNNIPGLVIDSLIEFNNGIGDTLVRAFRFRYQPASSGNFYFVNPCLFFDLRKIHLAILSDIQI